MEMESNNNDPGSFLQIVKHYLESNPLMKTNNKTSELEVSFGTINRDRKLTKIDYLNVVKYLYSCGFKTENDEGLQILRIQNQFIAPDGKTKMSSIRAEIVGSDLIQEYTKTNSIQKILDMPSTSFEKLKFTQKLDATTRDNRRVQKVFMNDYNFRVAFKTEQDFHVHTSLARKIISKWEDSLKTFRCLNRVRFHHPSYPVFIDISIVKSSIKSRNIAIPKYTIQDANVFQNPEEYEIEIEVDNNRVGTESEYQRPEYLLQDMKKCIRIILSGLQKTKYPISYQEQKQTLFKYLSIIHGEEHKIERPTPRYFIGPTSSTLQIENISEQVETSVVPNIRKNYTVTDKADGERSLLFIDDTGKMYLIDMNMNVIFTGTFTKEKSIFNSIVDGEYIKNNKLGNPIQLFAAFDVYYVNNKKYMNYPLHVEYNDENKDQSISRLYILQNLINVINPYSILEYKLKNEVVPKNKLHVEFRVKMKTFHSTSNNNSIFKACSLILADIEDSAYEYETDGLIFTPSDLCVGASRSEEKMDIKTKLNWPFVMKWKPPEFNTIDFLVSIKKDTAGKDLIRNIYQDGSNNAGPQNILQYKTLILRCGFDPRKHGYINPSQDLYNGTYKDEMYEEDNDKYKPVPFYPTNPADEEAHLCNVYLKHNGSASFMTTEEGESFEENMIVEFKYNQENDKYWKWCPIRVRYDKTSELRNGGKNFGNAFHTADNNWYSIHHPISIEMIKTGENVPTNNNEEVYYNNSNKNKTNTRSLRDFHNLYIKSKLIQSVSSPGNILIDYSVGKGGDIEKWRHAKLKFVFGLDISKDNIYNRVDGACARYLNVRKKFNNMYDALFVTGDSMKNIATGEAFDTEKEVQITNCVLGKGPKNELLLGKGVYQQYGIAESGFHVSSCQFSIHYFFEKKETLHEFLRNVTENTRLGGYFIATGYDGNKVFQLLKGKSKGESYSIMKDDRKIFEITKRYDMSSLPDDYLSLGYGIDVYQESINKTFKEYLVQFDFLKRVFENYGFVILPKEEANAMQLPDGSALFERMFKNMEEETNNNKHLKSNVRTALFMSAEEKTISFLNRYYIFKKVRNVDAKNIEAMMNYEKENEEKELEEPEDKEPILKTLDKKLPKKTEKKIILNTFN